MAVRFFFRKNTIVPFRVCSFCSNAPRLVDVDEASKPPSRMGMGFPSLLQPSRAHLEDINIELVDHDSWKVSSGLSEAWRQQMNGSFERKSKVVEPIDEPESLSSSLEFDDIEDMRFRGKLFYKLDRDSREFEEYNLDLKGKKGKKSSKKRKEEQKEKVNLKTPPKEKVVKAVKKKAPREGMDSSSVGKTERTPTFNQLTAPYHEPFCLDIFITKSSVRACIVHRATSNVVVVAHSISKDMKFDLKSTKDDNACAAVGGILAQRALADDIHDIVYTPRKGDKVEGKLQIVLQSLIDHGINVKVKIKKRKPKKVILSSK
ncbi:hypothetical protein IFM89_011675 [Coptis chinensis]|uniref:Uncharacterized protein n=1 Tax=Coptis chinensis TaxID=261450 RepID=A0A835HV53_9MAGN|nr:hypothetical protein IFM89_011675 [Coptis chinensis]